MALIDTKIGHKFTCKKPEQYDIMPRDAAAFLISEIEKVEEDLQRRKLALQHQTSEQ